MRKNSIAKLMAVLIAVAMSISFAACLPRVSEVGKDCEHVAVGNGEMAIIEGGYFYAKVCSLCGETVYQEANVISASNKWLYNESNHWNNVRCEEFADNQGGASSEEDGEAKKDRVTKDYKINTSAHELDENGRCKICDYKKTESEGLEFTENEDQSGYILTGRGECKDKHVNVPKNHNGKPVVGIGDGAFGKSEGEEEGEEIFDGLIGISIPKTVIYISCTAFADCKDLVNFIVDANSQNFSGANNCLVDKTNGMLVRGCEFSIIPEDGSIKVIGSYAFANLSGLVEITIPDVVEQIGDKAFFKCEALIEVHMPENANIGIDVFRGSIHVEIIIRHNIVFVPAKQASCDEAGNIEHYHCVDCGHYYADAEGQERIYDVIIPAKHNFANGTCQDCGTAQKEILIVKTDEIADFGRFPLGTLENAIGLPEKINVYTKDGNTHQLPIVWDLSAYDKSVAGEYTIKGIIQAGNLHFEEGVSNQVEANIEIVERMNGTADIVFVLDISGSMGNSISNVKNNIIAFAQAIEEMGVSARWSIVTYSDWTLGDKNEQSTIIKNGASNWYTDAESCKNAINGIDLAYGGDTPETALDGLLLANTIETRQDARVFYILLTDASCKDSNNYNVPSLEAGADIIAEKGINVSVIGSSSDKYDYNYLVEKTGGIFTNVDGNFAQVLLDTLVPIIHGEVME